MYVSFCQPALRSCFFWVMFLFLLPQMLTFVADHAYSHNGVGRKRFTCGERVLCDVRSCDCGRANKAREHQGKQILLSHSAPDSDVCARS